jgi:glycosyltransferase involved in cell wall biosynthesis
LIQEACKNAGLEFVIAESYHNSFITMPGFYRNVDCVVIASQHEGDGMVSLEAGASGRLVISTPVGHWPELCSGGGGLDLPIEPEALVGQLTAYFKMYQDNSTLFSRRCANIQKYAKNYDWKYVAPNWAELFS